MFHCECKGSANRVKSKRKDQFSFPSESTFIISRRTIFFVPQKWQKWQKFIIALILMSIDNHAAWLGEAHFCHFRHLASPKAPTVGSAGLKKSKKSAGPKKSLARTNKRTNSMSYPEKR